METDGGGWTVIQRRESGTDDFFRNWESYKEGFGNVRHDFWLGLKYIHLLTKNGNNRMRIDLWDWENRTKFSEYDFVKVKDESDNYRIIAGGYRGNAGDPFNSKIYERRMQSMQFSTFDKDNDLNARASCARAYSSGWWFNNCFQVNLNGVWYPSGSYYGTVANGIVWDLWTDHKKGYSLKKTEIKFRPEHF
ncbi:hypothetical protein FSP39_005071 [Pinctada imbricata]|uniref:Fibrinogen C-terminal domain-containing protein n=1 Tax=Pinctada imbricata TaxID=66713 RepID=A0AA88Y2Q7_PINIB|nr:hypothetical protein FSP39_005071 [Pinctada imbricata]